MIEFKKEITPYQYQIDLIDNSVRALIKHQIICVQAPTGAGKTVMFSILAERFYNKIHKSVIILVHREELLIQTMDTIVNMFGIYPTLIVAGVKNVKPSPVYIGMIESVINRIDIIPEVGLLIVDECHIAIFNKAIPHFSDSLIMGFTATPKSSQKKYPLNSIYRKLVQGPQISELIALKRLSRNTTRCPKEVVNTANIKITAGEYDNFEMGKEFSNPKYVLNTFNYYCQFAKGKKTMIFNVNVEHSLLVTETFNFLGSYSGITAKHIDGNTDKAERAAIIKWFKETPNAVLCNVGIATVGFDEPTIECIIVNRATKSMPLWLQMCGRGGRFLLGLKEYFDILDMGGNAIVHGDWSDDRDWGYIFDNPESYTEGGIAPTKICPSCFGMVHAAVAVCKLKDLDDIECGYVFNKKQYQESLDLGELITITKRIDIQSMIRSNEDKQPYFSFFQLGREIVKEMIDSGVEITTVIKNDVFELYFKKCEDWFRQKFPDKRFSYKWHRTIAEKHFEEELKKQLKNA